MERKNEKHIGFLFSLAFVFQILLQVLTLREAVGHRTQVLQYCNFTTKPAALLPFNEYYKTNQEIIQGNLQIHFSNTHFVPGIEGEPGGAVRLEGNQNSFIEIESNKQVQFEQSMTILLYINPTRNLPGPLVHYNATSHGVQLWVQGNVGEKGGLMARFNKQNLDTTTWLRAEVLNLGQWNFVGASYDHVTGYATLYHDALVVQKRLIGKNLYLATQYEIRIGAVAISSLGSFDGEVACLQFYSKALEPREVLEGKYACKQVVPLLFLSLNLTSPVHVAEANETLLAVSAITNKNVTKPFFRFDFGDGTGVQESFLDTAFHMYSHIGYYSLHVVAWTLCNSSILTGNANISVPKPVRILNNVSLHSTPTVFGETTQITLLVEQGTDFECLLLLGDTANQTTSSNLPREIVFRHTYSAPATYTAIVTCRNRRSELSVSETVQVQKVIMGLTIIPVPPILFGRQFMVRWQINDGTGVSYKANFSEVALEAVKSENETHGHALVTQNEYKTPGISYVHVAASNSVTKWISTSIKCAILREVSPFVPVLINQARDIEINETISLWLTEVNSGPDINASYMVSFGDNSKVVQTHETSANHSYSYYGLYTVYIAVDNKVSKFNTSILVKVHKPEIMLEGAVIPKLIAKVDDHVNITMSITKGSDFSCHWQFGDGHELLQDLEDELLYFKDSDLSVNKFTNISICAKHVFEEVGIYKINATCRNRLGEVRASGYATVQKEITFFQVLSIKPVILGKTFLINVTAAGTNVTFRARFERKDLHIENHDFYHLSKVTSKIYKKAGKYNITVTAKNLVTPSLLYTQVLYVEIPISNVSLNVTYSKDETHYVGYGSEMNIFEIGVPVVFKATVGNGSNLQYSWSINNVKEHSTNQIITRTFNTPGIYTTSVLVKNRVSQVDAGVVIAVQRRPSVSHGGLLKCSSPKVMGEIVIIQTTLKTLGTNSTLLIELNNITSYCYGHVGGCTELEKGDIPKRVQYRGELKKDIILKQFFNSQGVFIINATLGNAVSKVSTACEVEILSRPCRKPKVKLKDAADIPNNSKHFFRAEGITIEADVDMFCPESKESKYEWEIFQNNPTTGTFEYFHDFNSNKEASLRELQLRRRALPLGLFKVRLKFGMAEEELKDFGTVADGYIRVVQSPLIAKISGGSEIRRGFRSKPSIDGLGSYDPDVGPGTIAGIEFTWFCRNTTERFPKLITEAITGVVNISSEELIALPTSPDQGCYRDGQYLLSKTASLELTTNQMVQNETYVIVLVITKGERTSSATQKLEIGPENLPTLTIRCEVNCGSKMNPSDKLSLSTECKRKGCATQIMYSWSLFVLEGRENGETTWRRDNMILPGQKNATSTAYPNIMIKKYSFQGSRDYKLVITGTLPDGNYGRAAYTFLANAGPTGGTCDVEPRVGHVFSTRYWFWCWGWSDPDGPFHYEIVHVLQSEEFLLYYGREANTSLSLPLGNEDNNYTLEIAVRVFDRLGAATTVNLQVKSLPSLVKGTELLSQLLNLTSGQGSSLAASVKSGNSQEVALMIVSICSVLNHQAKRGDGGEAVDLAEKRKVRSSLILAITYQRPTSQHSAKLISGSLYQVTQVTSEISLDAQEASISALTSIAAFVDRESNETASGSLESLVSTTCGALGNLLGAASEEAAVNEANITNQGVEQQSATDKKQAKGKAMVKRLTNALDSLTTSLLRSKVSFEEASEFSTPKLTVNLKSFTVSDAGGEVRVGFANFKLPGGSNMFLKGTPGLTSVNQKVFSVTQNYYTYHNSSRDISSPVVSLSYQDKSNERPITVSYLNKLIEYFLPVRVNLPESQVFNVSVRKEVTWMYHKLVITSKDESVSIEVTPFNCSHKLQIFVRESVKPTKEKYSWRKQIWQSSSAGRTGTNFTGCYQEYGAYTLFLSNMELRETTYIIGVLYEGGKGEIGMNSNDTILMEYSIRVYKAKCLYWNQQQEAWMGDGCIVGPRTSSKQIHCLTNHLTTFGSGLLVAPNPLDFSKVFAGFKEAFQTGNVVVLFTILTLLVVYALLAVWAWRRDRVDYMQIGTTVVPSHHNGDYRYQIYFVTGSRNNSGTTAHVGCEIFGKSGSSGLCYLIDTRRLLFRRGDLNVFVLYLPSSLGAIRGLRVWHDNSGKTPAWFLNRAMLRDCQTGEKWFFLAARWLDVADEDGKVDLFLRPASEEDMVSFKKRFNRKIHEGICDNHLWFSVAYRPPRSQFTRLQRISCCLSLLFSFMVVTAMFYGSDPQPGDTSKNLEMGPIKVNLRTVIIAIESALVVLPVNLLIVALFRKSKRKEFNSSRPKEENCCTQNVLWSREQVDDTDSLRTDTDSLSGNEENKVQETDLHDIQCQFGNEVELQSEPSQNSSKNHHKSDLKLQDESQDEIQSASGFFARIRAKFKGSGGSHSHCFPHWCIYVGWTLCILMTLTSAAFTLFYSMMWGKEQSNLWVTTMAISFVQDTLISQPLKVLIVSLVFAIAVASPSGQDDLEEISATMGADQAVFDEQLRHEDWTQYNAPDKKLLKSLRTQELKRRHTIKLFTDLCVYVILLTMVMILSFQYRNPDSNKMIDSLRRLFLDPVHNSTYVRLNQVTTIDSIWAWTRKTLLPGLHPVLHDGSGKSEPFIADRVSLLLGVVRIRQVRIQTGTCKVNKLFKNAIAECNDFHSLMNEETKFYAQGWKNAREKPTDTEKGKLFAFLSSKSAHVQTSWEHLNAFEAHHILPVIGTFSTYSGGGYVLNFNRSSQQSRLIVDRHERSYWLDKYTRAVHAEFVVYNPAINMLAAMTITFEIPPISGVFKSHEVFTVSMYSSLRKHPAARIIGEVIGALTLVFMIYRVVLTLFHDKLRYFTDLAKVLDLILVLTGVVIIFLKVLTEGFKKLATDQFKENSNQFLDFYQCGFYDELTDCAFAFLNFIAIVRFAVFIQFLSCLNHILRTIARCFHELLACLFVFFCLMMAFSSMFKLAFNTDSEDFKDFSNSLQTSVSYMARMVRTSDDISRSYTIVRALALFSCCLTLIFFYLTIIRSVFIVGYRQTLVEDRGRIKEKSFESAILEIFVDKFKEMTGIEKKDKELDEEEDPKEAMLKAQRNYIDKSQFVRLQNLINKAYVEDFVDDLRIFEVMGLESQTLSIRLEHVDIEAEDEPSIRKQRMKLKLNENKKIGQENARDDEIKGMSHVLPSQEIDTTLPAETSTDTDKIQIITQKEQEKLSILEKLVQEKMKTLQEQRKIAQNPRESRSVEHDIQMLAKLQQRIDATKRRRLPNLLSADEHSC